jgi:uncharacterized membrane-anchored protein YhcB (DUF1043 family)
MLLTIIAFVVGFIIGYILGNRDKNNEPYFGDY